MIGITGPNVSSRATSISSVTPASTVASQYRSVGCPAARLPPATSSAPRSRASLDVTIHLLRGRLVVERPHRRLFVERVAEPDRALDGAAQRVHERVVDGLVHEEALARGAALSRTQEGRDEARLGGRFDVGVVEDDHRAVPSELEDRRLPSGARRDREAGRDRADESDCLRARAPGDLVADDRAGAGHHREDAGRQLGVDDALGELDRADRGRRSGHPDDRVPGRERRRDHLGGHRVRPVPRGDDADDAARDAVGEDPLRCVHRGRQRAGDTRRVGGCHAPVHDELLDLAVGLGVERLALVERQRAGEVVAALLDEIGDAVHGGGPLEGGARSPVASRGVRGGDCATRVLARPLGQRPQALPRRRARRLEARSRLGLDPLASDHHRVVGRRNAHACPREKALR